jgi:7-cyano-7-deazaguanine synthase
LREVCVLASGGLDSAVLLGTLARRRRVHPLYVRSGLVWEDAERRVLRCYLAALRRRGARVAPLVEAELPVRPLYGRHWSLSGRGVPGARAPFASNYLPGRNLLLVALAAVHCERARIPAVALGVLADNPFADATPRFLRALGRVAGAAVGSRLAVHAPFRALAKHEVIRRGRGLPLGLTLSCAHPRGTHHCGRCTKCAERRAAFRRARVPDPTRYADGGAGRLRRAGRAAGTVSGTAARPRDATSRRRRRRGR